MHPNTSTAINKVSEARLQANCYQWAYNTYPQLRGLIFSVPNGGTRNLREAQALKATGLTPGIPDILLLYNGIYGFEFKSEKGVLSESQKKIHEIWKQQGIRIWIINDENVFKDLVTGIVK